MKTLREDGIVRCGAALVVLLVAVGCGQAGDGERAHEADPAATRFEGAASPAVAPPPFEDDGYTPVPFPDWGYRDGPECTYTDPERRVDAFYVYSQAAIDALANCEVITGALWIESELDLDLRPLRALRAVDSLYIHGASDNVTPRGVASLEGLENLRSVRWGVSLSALPITTLAPLRNLRGPAVAEQVPFQLLIDNCDSSRRWAISSSVRMSEVSLFTRTIV